MSLKFSKRYYLSSFVLLFFIVCALALGISSGVGAYAQEELYFDTTNVIDDLKGANFVFEDYPKDENGTLSLTGVNVLS